MTADDVAAVALLGNETNQLTVFTEHNEFWSEDTLVSWIAANVDVMVVAEHEGNVVGFQISQLHYPSHTGYLSDIAISPDYRGQGIGTRLLDETLAQMKQKGMTSVYALTHEDNMPIQQLLQKFGLKKGLPMRWFETQL